MRLSSHRPIITLAVVALSLTALTGCASEARPWLPGSDDPSASASSSPTDSPSDSPGRGTESGDDDDAEQIDCAETPEVTIAEEDSDVELVGQCLFVTVNGANSTVSAEDIDGLVIQAAGSEVHAQSVGVATIAGTEMSLRVSGDIALLTINGDRNDVEVDGTISSLIVGGNENTVTAGESIPVIVNNGAENEISLR